MTLILNYTLGKHFVIMTSDTRTVKIKTVINNRTKRVIGHLDKTIADIEDIKVHKLTDLVLIGIGGFVELSAYLLDVLKKEVKDHYDLSDCRRVLEKVIKRERNSDPSLLHYEDLIGIDMNGFYRDGRTGLVSYKSKEKFEILETVANLGHYRYAMLTPVGHNEKVSPLFNVSSEKGESFIQSVIKRLKYIHALLSYAHPVEISPEMEIHVITLGSRSHTHQVLRMDTTEDHKLYDELKIKGNEE